MYQIHDMILINDLRVLFEKLVSLLTLLSFHYDSHTPKTKKLKLHLHFQLVGASSDCLMDDMCINEHQARMHLYNCLTREAEVRGVPGWRPRPVRAFAPYAVLWDPSFPIQYSFVPEFTGWCLKYIFYLCLISLEICYINTCSW